MATLFCSRSLRVLVNGNWRLVTLVITSLLLLTEAAGKPICDPDFYYDIVTRNCDHCSDICDQAEAMDTISRCRKECPGYRQKLNDKNCLPWQYYDVAVKKCESCDTVCLHADIRGSDHACKNLCPDWFQAVENRKGGHKNESTTQSGLTSGFEGAKGSPLFYVDVTNILVAVFVLIVSLLLTFLVAAAVIWRMKSRNRLLNKTCNKRPHQVQQHDSHELESLTGRGDPLAHPRDEEG